MALQQAKTWNINQQAVYYATAGVSDIPTTATFFAVGDWIVNTNPSMAVGDPAIWVCTSISGATPTFTALSYVGTVRGVQTATASVTVATTAGTVLANAASAGFTITLPTMGTSAGQAAAGYSLAIIKSDATTNPVTIVPVSSSTIDGASSIILTSQYTVLDVRPAGTANGVWYKIVEAPMNVRTAAPAQTLSTSDTIFLASAAGTLTIPAAAGWPVGKVLRIGGAGILTVTPVSGTVTGVGASVTLAAGAGVQLCGDATNYWVVG